MDTIFKRKRLERLGFDLLDKGHRLPFYFYEGVNVTIKCVGKSFMIWEKHEQIGVPLGHVKLNTIKDIIKQDQS